VTVSDRQARISNFARPAARQDALGHLGVDADEGLRATLRRGTAGAGPALGSFALLWDTLSGWSTEATRSWSRARAPAMVSCASVAAEKPGSREGLTQPGSREGEPPGLTQPGTREEAAPAEAEPAGTVEGRSAVELQRFAVLSARVGRALAHALPLVSPPAGSSRHALRGEVGALCRTFGLHRRVSSMTTAQWRVATLVVLRRLGATLARTEDARRGLEELERRAGLRPGELAFLSRALSPIDEA
jgi:hypothetical protein